MAKNTSMLLETLVNQIERKATTPEVLRGAWHLAVRAKNIDAMSKVAAAADLPEEILAAVEARTEIPIAVSYLTRDGLDIEERRARFRAEERASVLAGALTSTSLTDDDRKIIGEKLIAKPTRALSEAVITAGNLALNATNVAIELLAPRVSSLTEQQSRDLRVAVKRVAADPEASADLARRLTAAPHLLENNVTSVARAFLEQHPHLDDDVFEKLFEKQLAPILVNNVDTRRENYYRVISLLREIIGRDADYHPDQVLAVLKRTFDENVVAKIWTELVGAARAAEDTADGNEFTTKMLAAESTDDRPQLEELIYEALTTTHALQRPLLRNPNLKLTDVQLLAKAVESRSLVQVLSVHKGQDDIALFIYTECFEDAVRADKWAAFSDPEQGKQDVLDAMIQAWFGQPDSYYSSQTRNLIDCVDILGCKTVYEKLPWEFVRRLASQPYHGDTWVRTMADIMTRVLGSDVQKWETAEVLAENFTGTVGELLTASSAL